MFCPPKTDRRGYRGKPISAPLPQLIKNSTQRPQRNWKNDICSQYDAFVQSKHFLHVAVVANSCSGLQSTETAQIDLIAGDRDRAGSGQRTCLCQNHNTDKTTELGTGPQTDLNLGGGALRRRLAMYCLCASLSIVDCCVTPLAGYEF